MKDFDPERRIRHEAAENDGRDRSFLLSGVTFHYRANVPYSVLRRVAALTEGSRGIEVIDAFEDVILHAVEDTPGESLPGLPGEDTRFGPSAHARFHEVVNDRKFPVTMVDLISLSNWLQGEISGRPTEPLEPSAPGSSGNGTSSTDISSSTPVEASAA